jgi:hypothetical protein
MDEHLDQLERLHQLHKAGALSAQEFEAEKRRLLSSVDESPPGTRRASVGGMDDPRSVSSSLPAREAAALTGTTGNYAVWTMA